MSFINNAALRNLDLKFDLSIDECNPIKEILPSYTVF